MVGYRCLLDQHRPRHRSGHRYIKNCESGTDNHVYAYCDKPRRLGCYDHDSDSYAAASVVVVPPAPPSTNLIANGNLEAGSTNNPTGWNADYWGTLTPKFAYPVAGKNGGKAAQG